MSLTQRLKSNLQSRPHWMNAILLFCAYMTFIYLPWDVFIKPLGADQEVWLGLMFTGWSAKIGGVLHWLVYGAGCYGFWAMKRWLHPWAAIYVLQIAFSMVISATISAGGPGALVGAIVAGLFVALAVALWRNRQLFAN